MPRMPRLDIPGQFYHVIIRGIERCPIFRTDMDRIDFLKRFTSGLLDTGAQCFAWALMNNHVHLLLLNGVEGLAALMQPLLTGYAGTFNRKYNRVGHLFQNRYKAILCEAEPYFLELIRYIHLNPVRAGIIHSLFELARFPWTGHSALMGVIPRPWQVLDDVLNQFGSTVGTARHGYEQFMQDRWNEGYRRDLEGGGLIRSMGGMANALSALRAGQRQAFDARILGSGEFVESILRASEKKDEQRLTIQQSGWSLENLEQWVAQWAGVPPETLIQADRRRKVSKARALSVYAATEWLDRSSREMAERYQCSTGSICEARQRGRHWANELDLAATLALPYPHHK